MTGIFKQKTSSNIIILLVYGLILKFNRFLHPAGPIQQPEDHFLYTWLIGFLKPLHMAPVLYVLLTFMLLYSQALLFNRICNDQKLLPRPNYLPAMAHLLTTSLFVEWNYFSAPLLANTFLIWIFYRMTTLPNIQKPAPAIFSIGVQIGIVTLIYRPAIVFVALILLALFIMRPFRLREWAINMLGITMPYYFLALVLYLGNQWDWNKIKPTFSIGLPAIPTSLYITISIILLVVPFMIGGYFVQANLNKMYIHVRKSWSLLLLYLIMAMLIIMADAGSNNRGFYLSWMLCSVPITAFHAAAYFYMNSSRLSVIIHWILFGFAIYLNYWLN
ncbi:hypothetical protein FAM09_02575 [Niastella caeni]|uniref:Beta-carotene 15,15'-monooxygenase n=1 Tax=Niastella caeni TaxID=2569763 RepID=A0A4S8I1E4_9BACT|nr:hypothetical protein [Niastella caeni]THU41019.1 hypothetical protein FAM09_02575 [Niastella caeni]